MTRAMEHCDDTAMEHCDYTVMEHCDGVTAVRICVEVSLYRFVCFCVVCVCGGV